MSDPVYIRNYSDIIHTVGDVGAPHVGITWQQYGDEKGEDVRRLEGDEANNSLGIRQLLNTPLDDGSDGTVFQILEGKVLDDYIDERINKNRHRATQLIEDAEVVNEDTGELVEVKCMGINKTNGAECNRKVNIVLDGKELPLCKSHKDQVDRCKWNEKENAWEGLRIVSTIIDVDDSQDLLALEKSMGPELERLRSQGIR
ncbi:MAG: hypothetical protein JRN22_01905 [Nitrososphaerota archaeon]|nr:hypothetical protein [Nitrososphaerota archaeon]